MVKFEPQFQIKCIGRGEEDARFILEVIDMYWDLKGGFQTAIGEFWNLDLDRTP